MQDSHGQILALALRQKIFKSFKLFPLRLDAGVSGTVACRVRVSRDRRWDGERLAARLADIQLLPRMRPHVTF